MGILCDFKEIIFYSTYLLNEMNVIYLTFWILVWEFLSQFVTNFSFDIAVTVVNYVTLLETLFYLKEGGRYGKLLFR